MSIAPKALNTPYRGYDFRSRTEARWAVYFDIMAWSYEYEKEGYDLHPHGNYLPDFWLPQFNCWAEVKGERFTRDELTKAVALCRLTNHHVLLLEGPPDLRFYYMVDSWRCREGWRDAEIIVDVILDNTHRDEHRFYTDSGLAKDPAAVSLMEWKGWSPEIVEGVQAARRARFGMGEGHR
jgi:hypothetical protein